MKKYAIQFLAALPGVIMLRNAVGLLVTPTHVLDDLGMPMLNGLARNTELSDLTAFFLAATGFIFYGAIQSAPSWLYASAWMLGQ